MGWGFIGASDLTRLHFAVGKIKVRLRQAVGGNSPPDCCICDLRVSINNNKTPLPMEWGFIGASDLTRTGDLLITSEMHYRLCYTSNSSLSIISVFLEVVNSFLAECIIKNSLAFPI